MCKCNQYVQLIVIIPCRYALSDGSIMRRVKTDWKRMRERKRKFHTFTHTSEIRTVLYLFFPICLHERTQQMNNCQPWPSDVWGAQSKRANKGRLICRSPSAVYWRNSCPVLAFTRKGKHSIKVEASVLVREMKGKITDTNDGPTSEKQGPTRTFSRVSFLF